MSQQTLKKSAEINDKILSLRNREKELIDLVEQFGIIKCEEVFSKEFEEEFLENYEEIVELQREAYDLGFIAF